MDERIDKVLSLDRIQYFEGTPEETVEWLLKGNAGYGYQVRVGQSTHLVSVTEYLEKVKFDEVLELVRDAIRVQDPNAYACEITQKILDLF